MILMTSYQLCSVWLQVLYTFAIVLNIFMDAALTGAIAYGTAAAWIKKSC